MSYIWYTYISLRFKKGLLKGLNLRIWNSGYVLTAERSASWAEEAIKLTDIC